MLLRFSWQPVNLPQTCVCGKLFSVKHAFTYPCGGFPSILHNEIQDLTVSLRCVGVEPALNSTIRL